MCAFWNYVIIFFIVIDLSSAECGVGRPQGLSDKIVGGRNAEDGEFPWQASLQKLGRTIWFHTCGAVLINRYWLVTAAHCITLNSTNNYRIMIGNNNLTDESTKDMVYKIKMIIIKQGFDPITFQNDICLMQLFDPVTYSLNSVCLTDEAPAANTTEIVSGWGATKVGGKASPYLQVAEVLTIPREDCMQYYGYLYESMTCAGYEEGEIDACQGDSGGPLVQQREGKMYLTGITSFGNGCAQPDSPGVYTDVTQFVPWIKSYVFLEE